MLFTFESVTTSERRECISGVGYEFVKGVRRILRSKIYVYRYRGSNAEEG